MSDYPENMWERFMSGDRLACARLISLVENHPDKVPEIRNRLYPHLRQAVKVGITGPPGVGKSTITAALARQALENGKKVGIVAVDPSSPFTGGAFLGDRVRMQQLIGRNDVFIRSLASRSGGGLSPSTPYVADVFDAYGMDLILIETVGVGQAELDVLTCSDVIMLVLQPSTGDIIQMLKAGIMETADMFIVNKSDLPGSEQLVDHIQFIFHSSSQYTLDNTPPVLTASALQNEGIDRVFTELQERIIQMQNSGRFDEKLRERTLLEVTKSVKNHLWDSFTSGVTEADAIITTSNKLADDRKSPYPYIQELCDGLQVKRNRE